ncbi:MAG: ATP-binding cassette domain-containing protein [Okeania sp. SIO1H5]|nr:ATP-binding cassette domain-containing protein [Okeania sp. SIO1H5]
MTIEIEQLSVTYPPDSRRVLDAVSLRALPGRITGVVGPNGSGKTTLFQSVCALIPWNEGTIRIDEKELPGPLPDAQARFGLAYAPDRNLFDPVLSGKDILELVAAIQEL